MMKDAYIRPPYARVEIPGLGTAWAKAVPTDSQYRSFVENEAFYIVLVVLFDNPSAPTRFWRWSQAPAKTQAALLDARREADPGLH